MLAPVIFFALITLVLAFVRLRRWWQHRDDPPMIVTTWPEIEYRQPYGGWNADAYDAWTGRDRRWTVPTLTPPQAPVRPRRS